MFSTCNQGQVSGMDRIFRHKARPTFGTVVFAMLLFVVASLFPNDDVYYRFDKMASAIGPLGSLPNTLGRRQVRYCPFLAKPIRADSLSSNPLTSTTTIRLGQLRTSNQRRFRARHSEERDRIQYICRQDTLSHLKATPF